jgi:peptide deformylase
MILPVYVYGQPILRKVAVDVTKDYEGLNQFIANMWETMYKSDGVGLAAPQVGKAIRIFVIDGSPMQEDDPSLSNFKKVFINAHMIERSGDDVAFTEGCLSLPNLREEVLRPPMVKLSYYDENWQHHEDTFEGIAARIVQHEYDHLDGIMFIDHISALRRQLLKGKLTAISKGKVDVAYKIKALK